MTNKPVSHSNHKEVFSLTFFVKRLLKQ